LVLSVSADAHMLGRTRGVKFSESQGTAPDVRES